MKFWCLLLGFVFMEVVSYGQFMHQDVFKGIEDTALFTNLVESYKPAVNLDYGDARDTLYSLIDIKEGNQLECIYSGYRITLNHNLDPTTDAFDKGINAEHTYPQSKGAGDGLGRSDMHARGIFYFYTMYREEANNADPLFFDIQKKDLCQWHFADPVDQTEWERTFGIAAYQDGKPNPFVLDCSLASRLYCDEISDACSQLTATEDPSYEDKIFVSNAYPVPTMDLVNLQIITKNATSIKIELFNARGEILKTLERRISGSMSNLIKLPTPQEEGIYYIKISTMDGDMVFRKFIKV